MSLTRHKSTLSGKAQTAYLRQEWGIMTTHVHFHAVVGMAQSNCAAAYQTTRTMNLYWKFFLLFYLAYSYVVGEAIAQGEAQHQQQRTLTFRSYSQRFH